MSERLSDIDTLTRFLTKTMSMTKVYQPVVIREIVKNGRTQSKDKIAKALSEFGVSVLEPSNRHSTVAVASCVSD